MLEAARQEVKTAGAKWRCEKVRTIAGCGVLGVCLLLAACSPTADENPRHVVLISIDGLRPDYYLRPDDFGLQLPNRARETATQRQVATPSSSMIVRKMTSHSFRVKSRGALIEP